MWINADVVYQNTITEEKEIRITVSGYDKELNFLEDSCWITRDMLKEVLGEQTKDSN